MYHYDALGPERFQEFCQALISASFPTVQCLPIGQPDGGRDAFVTHYLFRHRQNADPVAESLVFQVKYVRNPNDSRSERDLIESVAKSELKKVEQLKKLGTLKYILITNLKGTAHPGTGSIDRINTVLSEALGVDAYCWWRDDIDRHLDNAPAIKWSYPEILKATDLLEKLVGGLLGEEEERRRDAIRAYLTSQYDDDQQLKFKQTDLRSTISELFVDLPMTVVQPSPELYYTRGKHHYVVEPRLTPKWARPIYFADGSRDARPSAEYFVRTQGRRGPSQVVLEGAPGQGKSTVTQFVCQVLRMQLLDKHSELAELPEQFRQAQARIPFRVDLRDLAKWILGIDPFQAREKPLAEGEARSLEGFLAGQVRSLSGGHTFNVSDLTAIAKASHLLLALDGFDEVADVATRELLVSEITKATSRLVNAGGYSVQTIVTSRPAAFAKSVRFPHEEWSYFELLPLERAHIDQYTAKWTKAKGLKQAETAALIKILDTKLREPHTQYLAKNPMQLTILLSLIHSRGASLPEKRTSMYDAYMDMFFSRESEKSDVVRDNRELLIDIHRYLAWKLQTDAEAGGDGSIEHGTLRSTLFSYLDREGEDTAIVDALFNGIIERVGALVSRVQETYEFEVQPLREYFVARHLYDTSPYPTDEREITGDKFDRFKALIGNPYWLNVARFYGGCFNKGEILTLVHELTTLDIDDRYRFTSHSRGVALMLLGDWVFSQYQPAVKHVISYITEYPQLRQMLANDEEGSPLWSGLPDRSGRNDFVEVLWERIIQTKHYDEQRALANAIKRNATVGDIINKWKSYSSVVLGDCWNRAGDLLGVFDHATLSDLGGSIRDLSDLAVRYLLSAKRFDLFENQTAADRALYLLLRHNPLPFFRGEYKPTGRLDWIATVTGIYQYAIALHEDTGLPHHAVIAQRFGNSQPYFGDDFEDRLAELGDLDRNMVVEYREFMDTRGQLLGTSIEPWENLVSKLRLALGDCPAIDRIAFIGAGIRAKGISGRYERLSDASNLVSAARYARLRSGAAQWWLEQLTEDNSVERRRLLLLLLLWGTTSTIIKIANRIDQILNDLDPEDWTILTNDFRLIQFSARREPSILTAAEVATVSRLGPRLTMYVGLRCDLTTRHALSLKLADRDFDFDAPEGEFALQSIINYCSDERRWKAALPRAKQLYGGGATSYQFRAERDAFMPPSVAAEVSEALDELPLSILALADSTLRSAAGEQAVKLLEIAEREKWFAH